MKKLAVIITRGGYNNILQACDIIRVAATNNTQVGVLFRDESVARMTLGKISQIHFSEGYRGREAKMKELLEKEKRDDLPAILRDLKDRGDVKLSICQTSLNFFEIKVEELIPELDEVQTLESFWKEEVAEADQVLTF